MKCNVFLYDGEFSYVRNMKKTGTFYWHWMLSMSGREKVDLVDSDFKGNDVTSTLETFARSCC